MRDQNDEDIRKVLGGSIEGLVPPPLVFIPELGFRAEKGSLILRAPVSVRHEGKTLTVLRLVSTTEGTELNYVLEDTQAPGRDAARDVREELRDESGRAYGPGGSRWSSGWSGSRIGRIRSYEPLPPELRRVQLVVTESGSEIGMWLDLEPLESAGLLRRESIESRDTRHGVTIELRGMAIGDGSTVLDLQVATEPWVKQVRGIGARSGIRRGPTKLRIQDDKGRELVEFDSPVPPRADPSGGKVDIAVFPRLPNDAQWFDLVIDYVVVEEAAGEVVIRLPVTEPRTLRFGPYEIRALSSRVVGPPAEAARSPFNPEEALAAVRVDLELGDWHGDRRVLYPGSVLADGGYQRLRSRPTPTEGSAVDTQQITYLDALSPDPAAVREITLRFPTVQLRGPWTIRFVRPA
jgi:hypothetical protein